MSLKIIENGAIQKLGCSFLFAFYSNYGAILYRLRDIATYWLKNREFFIRHLYLAPPQGVTRLNFVKMLDADKMIGLPYGEKNYDNMLSRFYLIPERHSQTNGQTDRQTDGQTKLLYQYRASVCSRAIKITKYRKGKMYKN